MVESPKVRRSSSNGNQRLYNNNMKWVTVRPDISQKRSSNINIYGQNCQIDEDYHFSPCDRGSLGSSLEDRPPNLNAYSSGSSLVDLSGFTPNSFEFKYPEIGSSPSCFQHVPVHSSTSLSMGNGLKSKLHLDTWKLANPDSTITIKKIKTSPRDKNNETKSIDFESIESDNQKHAIQAALIQPSSNIPATTNNNNNNNITSTNNTNTSRARSRQISRVPTYLTNNNQNNNNNNNNNNNITIMPTSSPVLSSSFSSASSLISHSLRRSSRANKNPVEFVIEKACQHALVLYNFEADIEEELSLVKDSTIIVVEQCADGWWKGRHLDSKRIASFPSNYVKLIPSIIPQTTTNTNTTTFATTTATEQTTNSKTRSESISVNSYFKDDPNIFFPTLGHQSNNNNINSGSFSFRQRSIRKNSLLSNNAGPTIFYQIKIYVPPFHEHTIIQMNGNENIKDLLEKLGRKKKMLFNEFKCKVRYLNSETDLPLDTHISLLQDSDKHPLKLFMLGFDYITKFNNTSTRNIQLSNYFNISYSSNNKNSNNNNNTITKHWVTFDNQSIQIFNNNTDQQPIRIIGLKYSSIKHSTSSPLSFIVKTPFAIIKLTHDHYYNIVNQWVDTIEACSEYNQGNPNIKKKQKKFIIKSSDSFSSSLSLSGHFPPPIDRKQQILEIRDRDINRVCVDCNSPDPEWASISLGCFLCDTCCGIHQRVLVNMSEVLSVILDDQWEDIHINIFDKIGNSVSNEYWEYNLLHKKIKPTSLTGEKELFIISKYKKKEFAPQNSNMKCPISLINNNQ